MLMPFMASASNARTADVPVSADVRIHVIDEGPARADRPTLVLLPGWRFSGSIWSAQIAAFGSDRRVISVDPRSQGQSTKTAEGNTPEQRAQDLHALLARLNVGRFVLVGWSQGVQDTAAYVERYGTANIEGIVLVDSPISSGAARIERAPHAAARQFGRLSAYMNAPRDYTEGMMRAVVVRPLSSAELDQLVDRALATPTATGAAMLVADLFGVDRRPALERMDKPVLIVASARSAELVDQRDMASRVADAEFHAIEDAGHAVFVDQPQQFNALLGAFLERIERGAR
ncbi:alpha/beta hydrolase [Sphingosinicella sp. LHD-64]|uniref:alpha/beta fold hydrolase n=1 Tax=Sphingosinicella sp. LHD-64 TaxID=3072139 RepID=UPI0028102A14|nr:alpha/beta hydrolase [Sphingosinicella sp. LHD-64]MDQ8755015.1 alpha/beta hydrolase [Sphingosinicella sp. LHD-64]